MDTSAAAVWEDQSMDAAAKMDYYTIEDIYALPDGQRAELIDGELYMMAAPDTTHQLILNELAYQINDYIKRSHGGCRVLPSPYAVFLNADDKVYLEPDISVICDRRKLTDKGCKGAPDWVIEIVSPSSRSMDYGRKLFQYHAAGVREYWIVDFEKSLVMVYNFEHDTMEDHTCSDKVKSGIYEDFAVDFSEIELGTE